MPFLPHLGESGHLGELQHDDHHHHCHHRRDYNDDDDDDRDNDQTSLKIKFHDCLPSPTLESSNMMMTKMVTKMATTLGYDNDDDGIWNMMMEYGNKEIKDIIAMPRAGESESVVGEGREWSSGFRSTHIADQIRIRIF